MPQIAGATHFDASSRGCVERTTYVLVLDGALTIDRCKRSRFDEQYVLPRRRKSLSQGRAAHAGADDAEVRKMWFLTVQSRTFKDHFALQCCPFPVTLYDRSSIKLPAGLEPLLGAQSCPLIIDG
jgi:hypothetical protein